jgi:alpha-1,2-mannosyltransferase
VATFSTRAQPSPNRRLIVLGAIVVAACVIVAGARAVADRYHDDNIWRNTAAAIGGTQLNGDFGYVFLPASNTLLDGESPYIDPDTVRTRENAPYAYPPLLALLIAPLAVLPEHVSGGFLPGILFSLVLIAAVVGALLLFDVRDWRCYVIAFLCPGTLESIEFGAIGPLLLLLIAVIWRLRDRPWGGVAAGSCAALKLFLWPLGLWLLLTGRIRATALSVVTTVVLVLGSWAVIGFRGLGDYPRLLQRLDDVEAVNSYSAFALIRAFDVPQTAARALVAAAAVLLVLGAWRAARGVGRTREEADRASLILVVAAALVLTPILWIHYLVLLIAPIALARRTFSALWLAPLALTLFEALDWYRGWAYGDTKALVSVAAVIALVTVGSLSAVRRRTRVAAWL